MWPGCYCFNGEVKMFLVWLREQADALILKIYDLDRMLHG
jgi:hypothetical protein